MISHVPRMALLALALGVPSLAAAGSVTLHPELTQSDDAGWIEPAINASYRQHAVAASQWLLATTTAEDGLSTSEFRSFAQPFLSGTFLSARYVWVDPVTGEQRSRIYHASSIRERPWLPQRIQPAQPYTTYFEADGAVTRATLHSAEGSRVIHTDVGGTNPDARQADAEVRLLRTLEADLRGDQVGRWGRLSIFVSTKVCDSCEIALQRFAVDENIDIHVHPLSRDPESAIRKAFRKRRKDMMDNLQCELALRKPTAPSSSTTSDAPPPAGADGGHAASLLPFRCSGVSVY
jgi:hypothetical protein